MKKVCLIVIFFHCSYSYSQFPAFTNFEGRNFYVDKNPETKKYRDIFQLGDAVDSYSANHFANALITRMDNVDARIRVLRADSLNVSAEKNLELITLQDSLLVLEEARDYYSSINKYTGTPGWKTNFIPVKSAADSRFFYQKVSNDDKISFFSSFLIQSNLDKTAISSDLISGAISIFQATISTTVTDNTNASNEEIINNKILYGALLNGELTLPIYYKANRHYAVYLPLSVRGSIDNVEVNNTSDVDNTFHFGEIASSLYIRIPFRYTSYEDNVSLFLNGQIGYIAGGSKFYDRIGEFRNSFLLSQGIFGIEVDNKFRIAFNVPIFSSEDSILDNSVMTVGIQIDPKLLNGNE